MTATLLDTTLQSRIRDIDSELKAAGIAPINDAEDMREVLGFANVRSVHRAIARGDIAGFKIGNRWRVRRREIASFIARREAA